MNKDNLKKGKKSAKNDKPYDKAVQMMITAMPQLLFSLVKSTFHHHFSPQAKIIFLQPKTMTELLEDGSRSRIMDLFFEIRDKDHAVRYHFEFETRWKNSIGGRMFSYITRYKPSPESTCIDSATTITFPYQCVVLFEETAKVKNRIFIHVVFNGKKLSYSIPVLKNACISIGKLFEKELYILIPFHIFRFERRFMKIENERMELKKLDKTYKLITDELKKAVQQGKLEGFEKDFIIDTTLEVASYCASGYPNILSHISAALQQEGDEMTEFQKAVIESLTTGRAQGKAEGKAEGRAEGKNEAVDCFLRDPDCASFSNEKVASIFGIKPEYVALRRSALSK